MKALVLAGGLPQIELIKRLKQRDYYIILADYTNHPIAESYADKFYQESTLDVEAMRKIAVSEKVDLIITVCTDQALNTVALLSEELGLPCYIDAVTGRNVTNKKYMKAIMQEEGIPTANYVLLKKGEYHIPDNFKFPLIIKPVDCNSSKGVKKVTGSEDVKYFLDQAFAYSRTDDAIVEEFIDGKELSVDAYVIDGIPTILCVSESQKVREKEKFIIFRSVVPAGIPNHIYHDIQKIAIQIVKNFNLNNCPLLIQMLYHDDKLWVIEFSARTGGGLKHQLIHQMTGIDIIDWTIDITLGVYKKPKKKRFDKYIINEYIYCYSGVYDHIEGLEELVNDEIIDSYFVLKNPETIFDGMNSSGDRIAEVTIIADSITELNKKYKRMMNHTKVIDVNGKDMMRRDVSYEISLR